MEKGGVAEYRWFAVKQVWKAVVSCVGALVSLGDQSSGHWAFEPVQAPEPPAVQDGGWCRNPVDRFLWAQWTAGGRRPGGMADRRTWIRRASFDLTGLPPTAEEVEAFEADAAPDAWARWVDRLLASPRYGEHWGRYWLDVVRYADTAGETADYPVPAAWRYRNYVIQSFNADKPYDEFLREQIAGDILARDGPRERYAERVTATGFLAISRRFGFDSENYHHLTIQDTIDTVGQSVLGLTLGCARCHTHKYDPISMPDYYALYGIFESTRYAFPGSEQKQRLRALTPLAPPEESAAIWAAYEQRLAALAAVIERQGASAPGGVLRSLDALDGDFEMQAPAAGGSKGVLVPPWVYTGTIAVQTEAQSPFKNLHPAGRVGAQVPGGTNRYQMAQALRIAGLWERAGKVFVNLDCRVATNDPAATGRHRFRLGSAGGPAAVEVLIGQDAIAVQTGAVVEIVRAPPRGQWFNVQMELDLSAGTVSGRVGVPGDTTAFAPRALTPAWNGRLEWVAIESLDSSEAPLPAWSLDNVGVQTLPIAPVSTTSASAVATDGGPEVPVLEKRLQEVAGLEGDFEQGKEVTARRAEVTALRQQIAEAKRRAETARREMESLIAEGPLAMAYAVSEGTPRNARIHLRGEPDRLGDEVVRGLLPILGGGPLPEDARGSGRLELARWLTRPENPLTARVMVNRIWLHHFGQGLVRTPNDFGTRGQRPENPALLDFLAAELVRSGWSVKAMHRLIMNSAAYRMEGDFSSVIPAQASSATANCPVAPDGRNGSEPGEGAPSSTPSVAAVLEARESQGRAGSPPASEISFPRRRLGAEELRDSILLVSGELDESPGEGHPFPAPTTWSFTQHGPFSAVYDHHRRSVYLMTQRIKRHPFLALFDGPDPNASTPERRLTTVPTQALFFLNDPFVHANADRLAVRIGTEASDPAAQVRSAYRRVLGRDPAAEESEDAVQFLARYREELGASGPGEDENRPLAALVRVLFGSNEFLTVD